MYGIVRIGGQVEMNKEIINLPKEYLILCDKYYKMKDIVNVDTYLEIFLN